MPIALEGGATTFTHLCLSYYAGKLPMPHNELLERSAQVLHQSVGT